MVGTRDAVQPSDVAVMVLRPRKAADGAWEAGSSAAVYPVEHPTSDGLCGGAAFDVENVFDQSTCAASTGLRLKPSVVIGVDIPSPRRNYTLRDPLIFQIAQPLSVRRGRTRKGPGERPDLRGDHKRLGMAPAAGGAHS